MECSHVAEELVQDCFLRLWIHRNEPSDGSVRSYLYRSVRNACFDHLKSRKVRQQVTTLPDLDEFTQGPAQSPEAEYHRREIEDAILAAIDLMPDRRREIFTLSRHDGLTYAEIADLLSISIKTVETQVGRALRFLRDRLHYLLAFLLIL